MRRKFPRKNRDYTKKNRIAKQRNDAREASAISNGPNNTTRNRTESCYPTGAYPYCNVNCTGNPFPCESITNIGQCVNACCGNCTWGEPPSNIGPPDVTPGTWECFVADTKITMKDGPDKNIQDVEVGDEVLSYNTTTHQIEPNVVTEIFTQTHDLKDGDITIKITFSNGTTTHNTIANPFWSKDKGFVAVDEERCNRVHPWVINSNNQEDVQNLIIGDVLYSYSEEEGELEEIIVTDIEYVLEKDIQTYDISVENNHTFFANGILTHNSGDPTEAFRCDCIHWNPVSPLPGFPATPGCYWAGEQFAGGYIGGADWFESLSGPQCGGGMGNNAFCAQWCRALTNELGSPGCNAGNESSTQIVHTFPMPNAGRQPEDCLLPDTHGHGPYGISISNNFGSSVGGSTVQHHPGPWNCAQYNLENYTNQGFQWRQDCNHIPHCGVIHNYHGLCGCWDQTENMIWDGWTNPELGESANAYQHALAWTYQNSTQCTNPNNSNREHGQCSNSQGAGYFRCPAGYICGPNDDCVPATNKNNTQVYGTGGGGASSCPGCDLSRNHCDCRYHPFEGYDCNCVPLQGSESMRGGGKTPRQPHCVGVTSDYCMGITPCAGLSETQCNSCPECQWTTADGIDYGVTYYDMHGNYASNQVSPDPGSDGIGHDWSNLKRCDCVHYGPGGPCTWDSSKPNQCPSSVCQQACNDITQQYGGYCQSGTWWWNSTVNCNGSAMCYGNDLGCNSMSSNQNFPIVEELPQQLGSNTTVYRITAATAGQMASAVMSLPGGRMAVDRAGMTPESVATSIRDIGAQQMKFTGPTRFPVCETHSNHCQGSGLCAGFGCVDKCMAIDGYNNVNWSGHGHWGDIGYEWDVNVSFNNSIGQVSCNISLTF